MLENQYHLRVGSFHPPHQVAEVVVVGLMCLTTIQEELDLLALVSADAHGAGHVTG